MDRNHVLGDLVDVLHHDGQPTGAAGNVAARNGSASMMLRCWNRGDATGRRFRGDWLITEDRGVGEGAVLRFVGREDDMIAASGDRPGSAEIEDCLLGHRGVATCGAMGRPDALRNAGAKVDAETQRSWVKERISRYSFQIEITFLEALLLTVADKVFRKQLSAVAEGQS